MSRRTIHIGARHHVINVEQLSEKDWWATTLFRGEQIEAVADTERGVVSALLAPLKAQFSVTGK
jgi:hypothetical protein